MQQHRVSFGSAPDSVRTPPFVGREREVAQLDAALRYAWAGRPAVVAVTGEPGIGKTRILTEFLHRLANTETAVLAASCTDADRALPYRPWVVALDALARDDRLQVQEAARACRETVLQVKDDASRRVPGSPRRYDHLRDHAATAVADLVATLASATTAVVVIDDLHWMDEASLYVLDRIVRDVHDAAILILVAYRSGEANRGPVCSVLEQFMKHDSYRRVLLEGFDPPEVDRIYRAASGVDLSPRDLPEVWRRTGGNPLLVGELARVAPGEETLVSDGSGLGAIVLSRTRSLPDTCSNLLYWAAVFGPVFSLSALAEVVGMEYELTLSYLEQAMTAELVHETELPGRFAFRHELIRDGFLACLSSTRVAMMHRRIADALEAARGAAEPGEIARHLLAAGDAADRERLAAYAAAAAERALRLDARQEALDLVQGALSLLDGTPEVRAGSLARLLLIKARALTQMRRPEAPGALRRSFDLFLEDGDRAGAVAAALTPVPVVRRLGSFVTTVFSFLADRQLRERALELAPANSNERGWLLCEAGWPASDEALAIASRTGDALLEMWTRAHRGVWLLPTGDFEGSAREHAIALSLARREGSAEAEFHCLYWMNHRAMMEGDIRSIVRLAGELRYVAESERRRSLIAVARFVEAYSSYLSGEWCRARELADDSLEASGHNRTDFAVQIALSIAVLSSLEQGDRDEGCRRLRQLRDVAPSPDQADPFLLPEVVRLTGDRAPLAWGWSAVEPRLDTSTPYEWGSSITNTYNALVAVDAGDHAACRLFYDHFLPLAGAYLPGSICGMSTDRLLGLLASTVGDVSAASAHFADAVQFLERAGYRPRLAHACCDYAEHLLRAGDRDAASQVAGLLDRSGAIADELGMHALAARLAAVRAAAGGGGTAIAALYGLTAREVEVLRLAARGFTNADIGGLLHISALTVATHIRNILRKTGVANRTELTAIAVREGIIA